ncbi:hypothetical protein MMC11_004601 [Xylographa trunciseda]|nr:hypothetical protein [Xylographa trunciseda]
MITAGSVAPTNSTQNLINELVLENAQQHRTATIIVGTFNIVATILMMGSILWDTLTTKDQHINSQGRSLRSFRLIHSAEVFPFVAEIAALIQSGIFVGVQSSALESYTVTGCTRTAEIVWPAVWLFSLTVLVFGLETTRRSLLRGRFRARGYWSTPICLATIISLTTLLWLLSFLLPTNDTCTGSLVVWTSHYAPIATALGSVIILANLLIAGLITYQLLRTADVDRGERIAATRIVYTQGMSIFILVFLLPYYIQTVSHQVSHNTSHISDIVLNLPGIFNALFHLFLRTNSERIAIRSADARWSGDRPLRLFGPNDLNMGALISTPLLSGPEGSPTIQQHNKNNVQTQDANTFWKPGFHGIPELPRFSTFVESPGTQLEDPNLPTPQTPRLTTPLTPRPPTTESKSHYSVFPTRASLRRLSWASVSALSDDEVIELPTPLFAPRHRRDISEESSEMVQIGLRISNATAARTVSNSSLHIPLQEPTRDLKGKRKSPLSRRQPSEESLIIPRMYFEPRFPTPASTIPKPISRMPSLGSHEKEKRQRRMMKSLPPIPPTPRNRVPSSLYEDPPAREPLISPRQVETPSHRL